MVVVCASFAAVFLFVGCATPVNTPRLQQLSEVISITPENASAFHDRGFAYAMIGRTSEARRDFSKALQLATNKAEKAHIHWSYGWALLNLDQYVDALDAWRTSLNLRDQQPWWAPHTLAMGYWVNGEVVKALSFYDKAAEASPERFATWDGLVKYTSFWTWKEKQYIYQIYDAWKRAYVAPPTADSRAPTSMSGSCVITNISFMPNSRAELKYGDRVQVTYEYEVLGGHGIRVQSKPYSLGKLNYSYGCNPSPVYRGKGVGTAFFTIRGTQADESPVSIDEFRLIVRTEDWKTTISEIRVPVDIVFSTNEN